MMIQNFIDGNDRYFTTGQKLSADFNGDGILDDNDLYIAEELEFTPLLGDVNMDGVVNVVDLISLVNFILGSNSADIDLTIADANNDGVINIVDVIDMVNYILAGGGGE